MLCVCVKVCVCVCGFLPGFEIHGHLRMSMCRYTNASIQESTSSAENMDDATAPWTGKTQECIDLARKHGPLMALEKRSSLDNSKNRWFGFGK